MSLSNLSFSRTPVASDSRLVLVKDGSIWLQFVGDQAHLPTPHAGLIRHLSAINALMLAGTLDAIDFYAADANQLPDTPGLAGQWVSLYEALAILPKDTFLLVGRCVQLVRWTKENAYCGRCGGACYASASEFAMVCPHCYFHQYPRINPCIIVLVTRGRRALLARNSKFRSDFYSCLAGFIEAGETAEQALHREVKEEVNVEVGNLRYVGSQSWPFPHSLMLGYTAEWVAGEILPDGEEIVAADWFTHDNMPQIPSKGSIARELIEHWRSLVNR